MGFDRNHEGDKNEIISEVKTNLEHKTRHHWKHGRGQSE